LASSGNWFENQKQDFEVLIKTSELKSFSNAVNIDARLYQNAGGLIIQQLAYTLAHLNEYLNLFQNSIEKIEPLTVNILISQGSNYFLKLPN